MILQSPPSLADYMALHSMVATPLQSSRCLESFDSVVFLPLRYDEERRPPSSMQRADWYLGKKREIGKGRRISSSRSLFSARLFSPILYYSMVILSATGLSTLCGWTTCHCAVEYEESGSSDSAGSSIIVVEENDLLRRASNQGQEQQQRQETRIAGKAHPQLQVEDEVLWYLFSRQQQGMKGKLFLKRRFEYTFLGGLLEVVMFHFLSIYPLPPPTSDDVCPKSLKTIVEKPNSELYLVEYYEWKFGWLQRIFIWLNRRTASLMKLVTDEIMLDTSNKSWKQK